MSFDENLKHVPAKYKFALLDVCDTSKMINLFVKENFHESEYSSELIVGLTKLVIETLEKQGAAA